MTKSARRTELNERDQTFIREYLIDLSISKAAVRAGLPEKTARIQGWQMLQRPEIKAAVDAALAERMKRLDSKADDVLREIARLALFDPAHLTGVTCPEDIALLPEDVRRAIVGWSWDKFGNFVVKMAKEGALEMLGRHHKLFTDKVEHSGGVTVTASPADERL